MTINSIKPSFHHIEGIEQLFPKGKTQKAEKSGFGEVFEDALREVNDLQVKADQQIEGLSTKAEGVTTHSAMIALEKADVAFQLMSAIRGKIIRAYEEVIRTQV